MKKIIIKQKHGDACIINGTVNENYLVEGELFFANFNGTIGTKHGEHYLFIKMRCNDSNCNFSALINNDMLSSLVKSFK